MRLLKAYSRWSEPYRHQTGCSALTSSIITNNIGWCGCWRWFKLTLDLFQTPQLKQHQRVSPLWGSDCLNK
jgi:hypothetical protein